MIDDNCRAKGDNALIIKVAEGEDIEHLMYKMYEEWAGAAPLNIVRLPGAGSNRCYFRLSGAGVSAIGCIGNDIVENKAFIHLAQDFAGLGVPEIYAYSEDFGCYLQEDLGDDSLFSHLGSDEAKSMIEQSLKVLAHLQTVPSQQWEEDVMAKPFNRRQIFWDLNYFKYEFLKPSGLAFDEEALENDFERFAETLTLKDESSWGFMYRDFQSRNVMIKDGEPRLIDFQGGRKGPAIYDAISFLWQAKAQFQNSFRREMLEVYAKEYCSIRGIDVREFLEPVDKFVLFRTLQVLGAYGFRGLVERKAHFIESIPYAIKSLKELIERDVLRGYDELERVCRELCVMPRWMPDRRPGLTVSVFSFSYKKGYPEDMSGNGGGFMFDCRAMHNPGRYAEYKQLTGLDKPVRDFLEERGEIALFVENALRIVRPSVERYLQRGFSGLQIGFGCTGGQHRSVYSAQAVAEALAKEYPDARIDLLHREQNIHQIYNDSLK